MLTGEYCPQKERAMTIKSSLSGILLCTAVAYAAGQAIAAQPLIVYTDQTQVIDVPREPGIVVIGNPSIADASIQGQKVFLHGRSYGTTNVIILDQKGAQLADFEIDVQLGGHNNVAMFKAGLQYSYVCAPDCEASMHVGDNPDWFKENVLKRNEEKINIATGQKTAEENQPAPAQ